jgi:large subunit ribosomal protein L10
MREGERTVDRAGKEELVSHYSGIFEDAGIVVIAHYSGLSVPEMDGLRHQMADVGGTVKVTKNRLVKLALAGTPAEEISDMFSGPTAIAYSQDPVAAPKVAAKFAKENENLVIIGGLMDTTVLDAEGVKNLASLPSLDELRGQLVGLINSPATKVAGVLQAPAGQLARVLGAKAAQGDAA